MSHRPSDGTETPKPTPRSLDLVLKMIRQVGGLAESVSFERSFKAARGRIACDRFLLGIDRPAGNDGLNDAICGVCAELGMPEDYRASFRTDLRQANHVYFGAERDGASLTVKGYLEFRDAIAGTMVNDPCESTAFNLFTGYKWDAMSGSRRAVSQYLWRPRLSSAGILQRLGCVAGPMSDAVLWRFITQVTERALARLPPQALQFVEVREEGHPRASIDVNTYKTGDLINDLRPSLSEVFDHFAIPASEVASLLTRIGTERVGHVAGGVDRHGDGFLTIYYGGTRVRGRLLQSATLAAMATSGVP